MNSLFRVQGRVQKLNALHMRLLGFFGCVRVSTTSTAGGFVTLNPISPNP